VLTSDSNAMTDTKSVRFCIQPSNLMMCALPASFRVYRIFGSHSERNRAK
jgi:hypothetical protein